MLFSILIANYNNGRFFKDCYESIIAQTYKNFEVIIVDDGSTDNSLPIIQTIISTDNRFKFYKNDINYGCGYTKKKCVELAIGEVCCFVDPDDALTADAIERNYCIYNTNTEIVLVHSGFYYCNEVLQEKNISHKTGYVNSKDNLYFNLDYKVFHLATFLKSAYQKTAGIDAYMKRAVDQDLYLKMAETGSFYHIQSPLYLYRVHTNSLSAGDKSTYWHWYAIIAAAKRRNINIEEQFINNFISRREYNRLNSSLKNSKVLKVWNYANKYLQKLLLT